MKKFFLSIGLGLTLATATFAADTEIDRLNLQAKGILAPYQNDHTAAQFTINLLAMNTERALNLAVKALYHKNGSKNKFKLKVDNLSYSYGDGINPTISLKGYLGIDFIKLLQQEQINSMVPKASELVEDYVKTHLQLDGAVNIKSVVTSTKTDGRGNYTGLTALILIQFDFTKRPEHINIEDIFAKEINVSLSIDLKKGANINSYVIINPDYLAFKEGEDGLKDMIDLLLNGDNAILDTAQYIYSVFDRLIDVIVEEDNFFKNYFSGMILTPQRTS